MSEFFTYAVIVFVCCIVLCVFTFLFVKFATRKNILGCIICVLVTILSLTALSLNYYYKETFIHYNITIDGFTYHSKGYYIFNGVFVIELMDGTMLEYYNPTDVAIDTIKDCECLG